MPQPRVKVIADNDDVFNHGSKSVSLVAVALAGDFHCRKGVSIKAAVGNSGMVYVGKSGSVTIDSDPLTDGFELEPGRELFIEVDNTNKIYLIASLASQKVYWISV